MEARNPQTGAVIRIPGPFDVWTGHPSGYPVPFSFRNGKVSVNNPDDDVIALMVDLADELGAHVSGDEGERY